MVEAIVGIANQLGGNIQGNILLRFARAAANVRRQNHVVHAAQFRYEFLVGAGRFERKYVDGRATQMVALQRGGEVRNIDHFSTRGIDQMRPGAHQVQLLGTDQTASLLRIRHVKAEDVAGLQLRIEAIERFCVAEGKFVDDVVIDHPHAQALSEYAELGADMAITHDTQNLATHFVRADGGLQPLAAVGGGVLGRNTAHQANDFGQHQFGNRTRVGIRCIEHGNAASPGGVELNLVGADAEAAYGGELGRLFKQFVTESGS